jgi:hypothetical protein
MNPWLSSRPCYRPVLPVIDAHAKHLWLFSLALVPRLRRGPRSILRMRSDLFMAANEPTSGLMHVPQYKDPSAYIPSWVSYPTDSVEVLPSCLLTVQGLRSCRVLFLFPTAL